MNIKYIHLNRNAKNENAYISRPGTHTQTLNYKHTHTQIDLFDQPIELELGAMDFAGFQMLSDPNATMIADPTIEDSFRRDLN